MLFGHVVQDYHAVLGLVGTHLLEIYLLNREEHFGPDLAHHRPLSGYGSLLCHFDPLADLLNACSFHLQLQHLYLLIKVIHMHKYSKFILLLNERFVQTVEVMVFACQQEVTGVLYLEHVLKLSLFILHFCLVVDLYRTDIVELYREAHWLREADWRLWQDIIGLLDCQQSLVGSEGGAFEVEN